MTERAEPCKDFEIIIFSRMDSKISFVILSFNSYRYLRRCFDSIIAKCGEEGLHYEIIVIDNGSADESKSIIASYKERYPHKLLPIFLPENMGTTYPRNLGLKKSQGEYICILDSDTELLDGSIRNVLGILKDRSDVGLVAPRLLLDDGVIQNSVKKFPTFWHKIIKLPNAVFKINTPNVDFYSDFPFKAETPVDSAISACWIFRSELLSEIGYLDEKLFYSPEDMEFCMRVRKSSKSIIYYPFLEILHHTQQISHNAPFSKISLSHFMGLLYYFRKHGGWFSTRKIYNRFKQSRSN
ncbi:MAG: glycosyltransferase [Nitrospirae bacterium]|nr:glycosyltransferase [Nitrospirota bacterium]